MQTINSIKIRLSKGDAIATYIDGNGTIEYESVNLEELTFLINLLFQTVGQFSIFFDGNENEVLLNTGKGGSVAFVIADGTPVFFGPTNNLVATSSHVIQENDYSITLDTTTNLLNVTFDLPDIGSGPLFTDNYSWDSANVGNLGVVAGVKEGLVWHVTITGIDLDGQDCVYVFTPTP